jgi:hypothetical protein
VGDPITQEVVVCSAEKKKGKKIMLVFFSSVVDRLTRQKVNVQQLPHTSPDVDGANEAEEQKDIGHGHPPEALQSLAGPLHQRLQGECHADNAITYKLEGILDYMAD